MPWWMVLAAGFIGGFAGAVFRRWRDRQGS